MLVSSLVLVVPWSDKAGSKSLLSAIGIGYLHVKVSAISTKALYVGTDLGWGER